MCGIAGILNFNNVQNNQLEKVIRMTNSMSQRGPDDEGFVLVDSSGNIECLFGEDTSKEVRENLNLNSYKNNHSSSILCFGHRRLSIIDLSPMAHQPMIDDTGQFLIVFNGEVYNFAEIRNELILNGVKFKSNSDTEVILNSYIVWGSECLQKFNGDFAFAIWNNVEKSIFCARDRVGIKPFYYLLDNNQFIFASDIKTLISSGLYNPEPDPTGLYLSMAFGISPRPNTAFKDIKALPQSSYIKIFNDGKIESSTYWNIPLKAQLTNYSENDIKELVEEKLTKAIKLRLVSDVPIGTLLSGGVDSSLMTAIASKYHDGIKAFTLGFENEAVDMDEVKEASETALRYPIKHIISRVNPESALHDISEWVDGYEEPFYSIPVTHVISKVIKNHNVKVVLNGLGGDELFSGYSYYKYHRLPNISWAAKGIHFMQKLFPDHNKLNLLSNLSSKSPDRIHTSLFMQNSDRALGSLFSKEFVREINTPDIIHDLYAKDLKFVDNMQAMNFMDIKNYVGNHFVHRLDKFNMAFSIEGRFPYLDHEFIESTFSIPSKYKIKNKEQKYILRRVAEKYIAPASLNMTKKGFGLPLQIWMKGPLMSIVYDSLEKLKKRGIVNPNVIDTWYKSYLVGKIPASRIWHLVSLELWFQKFIDLK